LIVYLDSSAVVKRYVTERGSEQVHRLMETTAAMGTGVVTRTEVVAALAKAVRVGALAQEAAAEARSTFESDWPDYVRLAVSEGVTGRAAGFAWSHGLRGYDAIHLAAARTWADLMEEPVSFATFDRRLWTAAGDEGLVRWPEDL
jgi:predicted nucleic acid-binding protein